MTVLVVNLGPVLILGSVNFEKYWVAHNAYFSLDSFCKKKIEQLPSKRIASLLYCQNFLKFIRKSLTNYIDYSLISIPSWLFYEL